MSKDGSASFSKWDREIQGTKTYRVAISRRKGSARGLAPEARPCPGWPGRGGRGVIPEIQWKGPPMKTRSNAPRDHYAAVTDRVIAALEAGTPPWRRPWDEKRAGGPSMPCNATTGTRYRGINVVTLGMSPLAFMSGDPRWATYKQAAARGWQVRKGERGTTAYFYKRIEVRDARTPEPHDQDAETRRIPLLRAFTLFHASQIEGISAFVSPTIEEAPWRAPEAAEIIVANSGVRVCIGGDRAFYSPATDHIQMPPRVAFHSAAGWSNTILHELSHASGHSSRLNRDLRNAFGSPDYSREELRVLSICGGGVPPTAWYSNKLAVILPFN